MALSTTTTNYTIDDEWSSFITAKYDDNTSDDNNTSDDDNTNLLDASSSNDQTKSRIFISEVFKKGNQKK